ncbi:MAG: YwaF family protein [Clostridia bacterium]|nr:YwaF family protein [Clostridia bacterium]
MYPIIIFVASILVICLSLLCFHKKTDDKFNKFLKIFTITFCAIGFFRFFLSDSFVFVINGASFNGTYYDVTDVLQTVLRWGYYLNYVILPMAIFFDSRLFKNIACYVCLFFSLLSAVFFNNYMEYFLSPKGQGLHLYDWFRYFYFILELVMAISIPVIMQVRQKYFFNYLDKKEWANFLISLPFIVIALMPAYVPQSLIGYSSLIPTVGSVYHIGWITLSVVLIVVFYHIFRFKDYKTRYMFCVFLTLALFFHYNSIFLMGITIPRLPIQLCNLAAYIYIITIPFKLKRTFQFSYIVNIAGAIVAYVVSDFSGGAFGFWNMHFVYEHTFVLMVPALTMALRVFPRVEKKSLKYAFIGFSIYFILCWITGTILNGFSDKIGTTVNYFFMFDLKKAFGFFPFLTFSGNYYIEIGRFIIYPVVSLIIYVAFSILYLLFYGFTRFMYKYEDDHIELRKSGIDLLEKMTKRKFNIPRDFQKTNE